MSIDESAPFYSDFLEWEVSRLDPKRKVGYVVSPTPPITCYTLFLFFLRKTRVDMRVDTAAVGVGASVEDEDDGTAAAIVN